MDWECVITYPKNTIKLMITNKMYEQIVDSFLNTERFILDIESGKILLNFQTVQTIAFQKVQSKKGRLKT